MLADTVTVSGWTAAVKVAGAAKVIISARLFGTGDAMDAYLVAFLLPSFFVDVLAGPIDAALVPRLVELREGRGRAAIEEFSSNVLAVTGAVFLMAAVTVAALSGWFLPALASSFSQEKLVLSERLLLCMILIAPLTGLSATWRAVLNAEHRFAAAAFIPMLTPLTCIVTLLAAGRRYGVMALAVATLSGAFLEAVASGVSVRRAGYTIQPRWGGITPELRAVIGQYAPVVAITLVMTGSAALDQAMAARLESGSVATLNYGTRLLGVLMAVGPAAVGTVVLPHISGAALLQESRSITRILRTYLVLVFALILPVIAVVMYFSGPLIRLLFQGGAFSEASTHLVAAVQSMSMLQVPIALLLALEIRLTSAAKANQILYRVAVLSLALTVVLDFLLMRSRGVIGIPLAGVAVRLVSVVYLSCKIYRIHRKRSSVAPS